MKHFVLALGVLLLVCVSAYGQPVVNEGGVLNAASYALPGLPHSGIAQGSLFVVTGQDLGPAQLVLTPAYLGGLNWAEHPSRSPSTER